MATNIDNGLKQLNDRRGHSAGDNALRQVATAVRRGSRTADSASRWGGDEFAVIASRTDAAEHLAERIRAPAVEAPSRARRSRFPSAWRPGRLSSTAVLPEKLRKSADEALYQAMRDGRNCVRSAAVPRETR